MKVTSKLWMLVFLFSLLLVQSCDRLSKHEAVDNEFVSNERLNIGTFNIAWLGDGSDDNIPRTKENYKLIADIILRTGLEVIGLQEIENSDAMDLLLEHLPGFSYYVSKGGGRQRLAVLYRNYIEVDYIGDYTPVAVVPNRTRPGMFVRLRKGNFDAYMLVVHFKSTSRFDDTPEKRIESIQMRTNQSDVVSRWLDSVLANGTEQDIIILGDFNDFLERKEGTSIASLSENPNIEFLTAGMKSCLNDRWYVIDHIAVSKSARIRYIENSRFIKNFRYQLNEETADIISDHCPIGVSLEIISQDND